MNRSIGAVLGCTDGNTGIVTIPAAAAAVLTTAVQNAYAAQIAITPTAQIAGVLISANTAAVQLHSAGTTGVGINIAINGNLYIPLRTPTNLSETELLYTANALCMV